MELKDIYELFDRFESSSCRKMELDWPVFDDTGEYMSIGYLNYVGILTAAIKELRHGI